MCRFENENIVVSFDEKSGYTTGIFDPKDCFGMNWVLENSQWGKVDGFFDYEAEKTENGILVKSIRKNLSLEIEKSVSCGKYTEKYTITNNGYTDFFLTKDNFGIYFPYNCIYANKKDLHNNTCITSIWCGGDVAWMCSKKPSGYENFLTGYVTEGSFSDYSLSYDISRVKLGADFRGDIVMHPDECVILPGQSKVFSFVFLFSKTSPDIEQTNEYKKMSLSADKYSDFLGGKINCRFECFEDFSDLVITCNDNEVPFKKQGNSAEFIIDCDTLGEKTVFAKIGGKKTFMKINVLRPLEDILIKRAEFITKKQQYLCENSPYDGAYLIYDRTNENLYCDESFMDNNACRERISNGVVVLQALQKKYDKEMFESISKNREFIEREIFDADTGTVFNGVGRDNRWNRAYNYPWVAVYYLEWYNLTKEKKCLENAAKIMICYYENAKGGRQESPCMRFLELCALLEKENMGNLLERLKNHVLVHADRVVKDGSYCFSEEVSCEMFMFCGKVNVLYQAYMLSGNKDYLKLAPEFIKKSDAFYAQQPDYHTNFLMVRYWDLYWFGKSRTYGDTMPQWICALPAETYDFMEKAGFGSEYKKRSEAVLKNNLCAFLEDGFASSGYLVPYRVEQYSSDPEYKNPHLKPKVTYGKIFDDYANDQDWALYYAAKLLK